MATKTSVVVGVSGGEVVNLYTGADPADHAVFGFHVDGEIEET